MKHRGNRTAGILLASGLMLSSTAAFAQIEEILVTATKTGAVSVQDISQSVQAFDEGTLERMGVQEFTDFSRSVPGLDVIDLGPGQKTYIMRGVSGPGESTVGVYVDNIPMIGSGQDAPTSGGNQPDLGAFDMERIEVVRGPQGTLYGQSSVSGVVRYITNKPDASAFEARLQLDGSMVEDGDPNSSIKGMVNIPLIDNELALRLVGYQNSQGGFIDNAYLGKDASCYQRDLPNPENGALMPEVSLSDAPGCGDGSIAPGQENVNSYDVTGVRAQLGWNLDDRSTLLAQYFYQDVDMENRTASNPYDSTYNIGPPFIEGSNVFFTPAVGDRATNVRSNEPHTDEMNLFALEYERQFDNASLTVALNRLDRDVTDARDSSSPARLHRRFQETPLGPWGGTTLSSQDHVISYQEQGTEQTTFEARIASDFSGPFNYLAGVYYQDLATDLDSVVYGTDPTTGNVDPTSPLVLHRVATVDQTSSALFGELYYELTDTVELLGGVRYFEMERDQYSQVIIPFANSTIIGGPIGAETSTPDTFDDLTIKLQVTAHIADNAQIYYQFAEGFRAGGVNAQIVPAIPPSYAPDTAKSQEIGLKTEWLDGSLYANFSAYRVVWSDLQMSAAFSSQFNGMVNCTEQDDPVESNGYEAEIIWQVNDRVDVGVNYTLMDATWQVDPTSCLDATIQANLNDPIGGFAGQKLVGVPDASGSAYLEYQFDWFNDAPGYLRADWVYQAEVDVNQMRVDRNIKNPSYNMANLRIGMELDSMDLALYVKNVTDETAQLSFFNTFQQENRVTPSQPRTVGVTLDWRF